MLSPAEFEFIYQEHSAMVERNAQRVLGDPAAAQDVTHEVFAAFVNYARRRDVRCPAALLYRMAIQYSVKSLRKRASRREVLQVNGIVEEPYGSAERSYLPTENAHETFLSFKQVMAIAEPSHAEVAYHYFVGGLTLAEIAKLLDMTERTAGIMLKKFIEFARGHIDISQVLNREER